MSNSHKVMTCTSKWKTSQNIWGLGFCGYLDFKVSSPKLLLVHGISLLLEHIEMCFVRMP